MNNSDWVEYRQAWTKHQHHKHHIENLSVFDVNFMIRACVNFHELHNLRTFRHIPSFDRVSCPLLVTPLLLPGEQIFNLVFDDGAQSIYDHRDHNLVADVRIPVIAVIVELSSENVV